VIIIGANIESPKLSIALSGIGLTFKRNGLGVGSSTVFEIDWAVPVIGGWKHHARTCNIMNYNTIRCSLIQERVWFWGGDFNGFEILGHFLFREDRTIPCGHNYIYHQMLLDTRNKNIYGLGVGISIVFEIFSNFPFWGWGGWGLTSGAIFYVLPATQ
jgi:hypothetical protein